MDPASPDGSTCILRFHAGPPYEDIAFRVVNKEWWVPACLPPLLLLLLLTPLSLPRPPTRSSPAGLPKPLPGRCTICARPTATATPTTVPPPTPSSLLTPPPHPHPQGVQPQARVQVHL